ncbi:MAG: PAS domain-containing protein [Acetobacteraceae bacterium]
MGRTVQEIRPDILGHIESDFSRAAAGERIPDKEYQMPGRERIDLVTVSAPMTRSGEVIGLSVTVIDISERRPVTGRLSRWPGGQA